MTTDRPELDADELAALHALAELLAEVAVDEYLDEISETDPKADRQPTSARARAPR